MVVEFHYEVKAEKLMDYLEDKTRPSDNIPFGFVDQIPDNNPMYMIIAETAIGRSGSGDIRFIYLDTFRLYDFKFSGLKEKIIFGEEDSKTIREMLDTFTYSPDKISRISITSPSTKPPYTSTVGIPGVVNEEDTNRLTRIYFKYIKPEDLKPEDPSYR